MGHRNLGHLATHHQQIIHFSIIQAVIHRLIRAEDSFRSKLLRGFLDKIFQASILAGKPNQEKGLQTCQNTRRNHSQSRKFSLSTTLHATPSVGVVGSKTVRQLDLISPRLRNPCGQDENDAIVASALPRYTIASLSPLPLGFLNLVETRSCVLTIT